MKRLRHIWRHAVDWYERRRAVTQVIAASRFYLRGAYPCARFHSSGKLEIRNGVLSDYCRACGIPFGAHRAKAQR